MIEYFADKILPTMIGVTVGIVFADLYLIKRSARIGIRIVRSELGLGEDFSIMRYKRRFEYYFNRALPLLNYIADPETHEKVKRIINNLEYITSKFAKGKDINTDKAKGKWE